jgi:hypothetical protein
MQSKVKIPKSLHELFGEEQIKSELIITITFAIVSFLAVIVGTKWEWFELPWYKIALLFILLLDILGGAAANLSIGTNQYYHNHAKKRWIFLAIHIQPFVFAWILQSDQLAAFMVWSYTIASSVLTNLFYEKGYQRILAGALFVFGVLLFILAYFDLPTIITTIYLVYMFKLIYGFSVDHQKANK